MYSRKPFYIIVAVLFLAGLALMLQRHFVYEVPWMPGEKRQIWSIEAKVEFEAQGKPVKASLAIPGSQPGFTLMNESAASPGYGLSFVEANGSSRAEWTIRNAQGHQELYYKVDMMHDPFAKAPLSTQAPAMMAVEVAEPYATAMDQVLSLAKERSADGITLTRELIKELNNRGQNAELLAQYKAPGPLLVELLHRAAVPARLLQGLQLEDGRRRQPLINLLQVYEGESYELFNPETGAQGLQEQQLLWEYHSSPVLDLVGGNNSRVTFTMLQQEQPTNIALAKKFDQPSWIDVSLYNLPLEEQALFKGILLVPIGVLVVVFLRIIVGVKTSGTFMPVLIAMAFIQTSLITGLVGFLIIVGTGLILRSYLSHLNLLLVARISAVIIMVIGIIGFFSIMAYQLGLTEGMKITFFPMIILAWTIERMSILWEEEGPKEVVKQGGGSLMVAVVAFLAMNSEIVRHITFNFLGLQLIVMAVVLLLGNYTGYRLTELKRFKPLVDEYNTDGHKHD
ncbi:inactive transglutaminase family protein [Oceanisphaera pacifica]|uniref:Inactive transglutaminase family protein n=1 Tax=Oceanisphaera pacifica TaxID=2818389 RepID=A0ABS3NHI1_9GAMM|nr:inactive transglutaminase family protein [Oceanisphaera pacifica]MBO1520032.1 inactive transglutaminase family protein [Oceanisphaera pacifica]